MSTVRETKKNSHYCQRFHFRDLRICQVPFISKGETHVDLMYLTALKIHTAFCWVMFGWWVPVFCGNILASPSYQKAATGQHIVFTCEWCGMSLVEEEELAASVFTLGYPEDCGTLFCSVGTQISNCVTSHCWRIYHLTLSFKRASDLSHSSNV
jgi:hypothetical protein